MPFDAVRLLSVPVTSTTLVLAAAAFRTLLPVDVKVAGTRLVPL